MCLMDETIFYFYDRLHIIEMNKEWNAKFYQNSFLGIKLIKVYSSVFFISQAHLARAVEYTDCTSVEE